jgi:hypothetical protein
MRMHPCDADVAQRLGEGLGPVHAAVECEGAGGGVAAHRLDERDLGAGGLGVGDVASELGELALARGAGEVGVAAEADDDPVVAQQAAFDGLAEGEAVRDVAEPVGRGAHTGMLGGGEEHHRVGLEPVDYE